MKASHDRTKQGWRSREVQDQIEAQAKLTAYKSRCKRLENQIKALNKQIVILKDCLKEEKWTC